MKYSRSERYALFYTSTKDDVSQSSRKQQHAILVTSILSSSGKSLVSHTLQESIMQKRWVDRGQLQLYDTDDGATKTLWVRRAQRRHVHGR